MNEKLVLVNVNFMGNEVRQMVLENLTADPEVAVSKAGQVYYNGTSKKVRYFDGTEWKDFGAVQSIELASGETVLSVTSEDGIYTLGTKISATQGTGVSVTKETDGLKVEVQDATTEQKGIVQLLTPESEDDWERDDVALTPLGALASKVTIDDSETTMGYLKSYTFYQGDEYVGVIDIPKDFLLKNAKVKVTVAFDEEETYEADDLVVYDGKLYRALEAFGPASFDPTKFIEVTTLPADVGMTVMIFIINVKEGTADSEYLYVNFNQLAQTYSADEVSLHKDTNNVFSIKDDKTEVTTPDFYKFSVDKYGRVQVDLEGTDPVKLKTVQVAQGVIGTTETSEVIALPIASNFISAYAMVDGHEVVVDTEVEHASSDTAGSVTFTIASTYTSPVDCYVTYAGYEE